LGAWCLDPTSKDQPRPAFCSFIPNLIARDGMLENQVLYQRNRSAYAAAWFRGRTHPVASDSAEYYAVLAPDRVINRRAAEAATGDFTVVYRTDDGRILTFDEAFDELTPELAEGLPPDVQCIDGGDVEEYILETGVYESIETEGRVVVHYTDGRKRWSAYQLREHILPASDDDGLTFEDWLAVQVHSGKLTAIGVLQYLGYDDAEVQIVIDERLIVD
jgi:hypothetical protein